MPRVRLSPLLKAILSDHRSRNDFFKAIDQYDPLKPCPDPLPSIECEGKRYTVVVGSEAEQVKRDEKLAASIAEKHPDEDFSFASKIDGETCVRLRHYVKRAATVLPEYIAAHRALTAEVAKLRGLLEDASSYVDRDNQRLIVEIAESLKSNVQDCELKHERSEA